MKKKIFLTLLLLMSFCKSHGMKPVKIDPQLNARLSTAVWMNRLKEAKMCIDQGANVNAKDKKGLTPLHCAAQWGRKEIVKLLLMQRDVNIEAQDNENQRPLHYAAEWGHTETAKQLIQRSANIDAKDKNNTTSLHLAACAGYIKMTKLLIQWGADINAKDKWYRTPLHLSLYLGKTDTANLLIQRGADIDAKDMRKTTPLQDAEMRPYEEAKDLIRKYVAKHDELTALLDDAKTFPAHLQQIERLIADEYTPQYDKQTAIRDIFKHQGTINQKLCNHILFNHRFFTDEFEDLCSFAMNNHLVDKDGREVTHKIDIFCPDKKRVAEIKDIYMKERLRFMAAKHMQKDCVSLQDKRLAAPKFLL